MESFDVIVTTDIGLENVVKKEILNILKSIREDELIIKPFNLNGKILLKNLGYEDIIALNYKGRTFHRVYIFLGSFDVTGNKEEDFDIFYKKIKEIEFEKFINKDRTFAVDSERIDKIYDYTSIEMRAPIGQAIRDRVKDAKGFVPKVDLDSPDLLFRVELYKRKAFVMLDTTGKKSLAKRGYRVFYHPAMLKPTIAASMLIIAGWTNSMSLLDPFCGSGTIPIEAALMGRNIYPGRFRRYDFMFLKIKEFSEIYEEKIREYEGEFIQKVNLKIYGYDKNPEYITGAKRNAMMAGVEKDVIFGIEDIRYLFFKFEGKTFDRIITNPPFGIRIKEKDLINLYYELFDTAIDLLPEDGRLVLITPRKTLVKKICEEKNFIIEEEYFVDYGTSHAHIFRIW